MKQWKDESRADAAWIHLAAAHCRTEANIHDMYIIKLGKHYAPLKNDMVPSYVEHAAPGNKDDVSGWLYHDRSFWRGVSIAYMKSLKLKRILATNNVPDHCADKGMVPLVSQGGIHQLHIFIFVLAVFHVLYCILTLALGRAKCDAGKYGSKRPKLWNTNCQIIPHNSDLRAKHLLEGVI